MTESEAHFCPKCGTSVLASAAFCSECGASMPEDRAAEKAASSSADEDATQIMSQPDAAAEDDTKNIDQPDVPDSEATQVMKGSGLSAEDAAPDDTQMLSGADLPGKEGLPALDQTVVVPARPATPPPSPPGNTGTAAPGKRKGGAGRIILIAVIAFLALLVIAGALGYFFYLKPRMDVKSFTEDLAPLVERDKKLSSDLDEFDSLNNLDDEEFGSDEYLDKIKAARDRLESSRAEYEDILNQINALDSSADTDALKQDFVELNQFYINEIDRLDSFLDYFEKLTNSMSRMAVAAEELESRPKSSSLAELVAATSEYNRELKKTVEELKQIEAPEGLTDFHGSITNVVSDLSDLLDELIAAINSGDKARIEEVGRKYTAVEEKFDKQMSDNMQDMQEEFEDLEKEVEDEEETLIADARGQISAIKTKYGDRWVSGSLNFDIDEGWLKDSE